MLQKKKNTFFQKKTKKKRLKTGRKNTAKTDTTNYKTTSCILKKNQTNTVNFLFVLIYTGGMLDICIVIKRKQDYKRN